jgi:hypothetical protein
MSNSKIKIILSSDSDYEHLTAEMFYKGKFVALLNQDAAVGKMKIEFPAADALEGTVLRKIELSIFEEGINLAKDKLKLR